MLTFADIPELEIFRAGEYPQGRFTEADLERIAADYDPAWHEAPCCITHEGDPEENLSAAAYGWVRRLWVRGASLFAEIKDVPAEFAAALAAGRFRKRSAGLYTSLARRDGTRGPYLRHVAWVPVPQVKGLADPDLSSLRAVAFREAAEAACVTVPLSQEEMRMPEPEEVVARPPESAPPAEGADRSARIAELDVFFAEMVGAGRLTPAQAEVERRALGRIAGAADFGEADGALLADKRREIAGRPVMTALFAEHGRRAPSPSDPADDDARRSAAAEFARHRDAFRRLGVREESLLALARAERGR